MIYFDNNATTAVSEEVFSHMLPFLQGNFANPSSSHQWGQKNRHAIEEARQQVASLLECEADEIYFTGCASEANNTLIKGIAHSHKHKGKHLITSSFEHPSVLRSCAYLEKNGYEVTYLPVSRDGQVSLEDLEKSIRPDTILISIMHANNEVGTIQDIAPMSALAAQKGILFHSDAAQSVGKEKVSVKDLGVHMLTIAGHKFHAPKGIGAFYLKRDVEIEPLIHGTGHERGKRAGTENLPFCIALGKACAIIENTMESYRERLCEMRDLLWNTIHHSCPDAVINGGQQRLSNTVNLSFPGLIGAEVLSLAPDIAASTGAACTKKPGSFVLRAMGIEDEVARGAIRFSLSKYNTQDEVLVASEQIVTAVKKLQNKE
ncbi:cysteine desulfurase family protein [Candidatus Uabimicrobium amorphum]|uniref:cysteine desulfurase n=1 Tax=Uabimicrobium amorphum TaxID=2596890 RepID=A0A5S9F2P5_UABAM|nr:cysteine desulfurase family protein [Candidatus Uabimicrobium amorphum]BBM82689.1 cysteine desulfurase [Candidatus Uabimicrobium amorphum]